jgi:hypothetical protein
MLSVCLQVDYSYRKDIVIGLLKIHQILKGVEIKFMKLSTIFNLQSGFIPITGVGEEDDVDKLIQNDASQT